MTNSQLAELPVYNAESSSAQQLPLFEFRLVPGREAKILNLILAPKIIHGREAKVGIKSDTCSENNSYNSSSLTRSKTIFRSPMIEFCLKTVKLPVRI